MHKYISYLLAVVLIYSCGRNVMFDEVQSISKQGWKINDSITFTVPISDTSKAMDILIHSRNSNSYEYSNLWLFITTSAPNGDTMKDTVEFVLAEDSGKWLGSGLGAINTMLMPYKLNVSFPFRGVYIFNIQHAMRNNSLNGILDIGVRIEERD